MADSRSERSRAAILHAIRALTESRAVEDISLDEVAEESGLSKATLYRHAKSPAHFAAAMLRKELRHNIQIFLDEVDVTDPYARRLAHEHSLTRLWRFIEDNFTLLSNSINTDSSVILPVLIKEQTFAQQQYVRQCQDIIEIPQSFKGSEPDWTLDFLARQYGYSVTGLTVSWLKRSGPRPLSAFVDLYFDLMPTWQKHLLQVA